MITEPARLAEISVDLTEISVRRDENLADRNGNFSFIKTKNKNILLCILFKLLIYHLQWSVFFFYDFLTFFKKDEITII